MIRQGYKIESQKLKREEKLVRGKYCEFRFLPLIHPVPLFGDNKKTKANKRQRNKIKGVDLKKT